CCSKCGREGSKVEYVGQSQIVAADGRVLAKARVGDEELVVATIDPAPGRPAAMNDSARARLLAVGGDDTPGPVRGSRDSCGSHAATSTDVNTPEICGIAPDAGIQDVLEAVAAVGARAVCVSGRSVESFVDIRCRAIDGLHVLIVEGPLPDEAH